MDYSATGDPGLPFRGNPRRMLSDRPGRSIRAIGVTLWTAPLTEDTRALRPATHRPHTRFVCWQSQICPGSGPPSAAPIPAIRFIGPDITPSGTDGSLLDAPWGRLLPEVFERENSRRKLSRLEAHMPEFPTPGRLRGKEGQAHEAASVRPFIYAFGRYLEKLVDIENRTSQ